MFILAVNFHTLLLFYHLSFLFFFFNDTATTEIYTLSLHDALPISKQSRNTCAIVVQHARPKMVIREAGKPDRKSTRLNSSHANISYAVFCLKKKKKKKKQDKRTIDQTKHIYITEEEADKLNGQRIM